jgi:4-hydroxybenzoate polyprenyltransferase
MKNYLKEMRPKSWLKNAFIFIPITFALELTEWGKLFVVAISFISFCLVASAVYVFNDINDYDEDVAHPVKSRRPIASGAISKMRARIFFSILALAGSIAAGYVGWRALFFVAIYFLMNLAYTLNLKYRTIFDVFCIAAGFVLRILVGGAAIVEEVSDWLFLTVVAMSLFMAFGKRRGELLVTKDYATRGAMHRYNNEFLDGMIYMCAGVAIVFYSLWAMTRGHNMIYTVPLIIFIVCRYLLLVHNNDSYGDPTTAIFSSRTLLVACGVYAALTVGLLYGGGTR